MAKRKSYVSDFETTTDKDDCRVWAYGWMEIGDTSNYAISNDLHEFMMWVENVKADIYFHNLKFDGSFIINYLFRNGFTFSKDKLPNTFDCVISDMGQWYLIDITYAYYGKYRVHSKIMDSLKMLPYSVEKIGKDFKLGSEKVDVEEEFYKRYRPVGHKITEEEKDYIYYDLRVMADAVQSLFIEGLKRMTAGSNALQSFKDIIGKKLRERYFPEMTLEMDAELRKAYRGGFTWLNKKYKQIDINQNGIVFDVNSLYPAMMMYRELPYGEPIEFYGEYEYDEDYPLYIQHIRCEFEIKDNHIPTIQIKSKEHKLLFKMNEYLETSKDEIVDLYVTNVDLELIKEHYHLYDLEYLNGWKFKSQKGIFDKYISKFTLIKQTTDGARKQQAKLMLNSLYGKFASNPDVSGKIPYLDEGVLKFETGEEEFTKPVYTPMGIFITSYARDFTIRTAQKCYDRIIYCDTDSIHLVGSDVPDVIKDIVDDKKLGYWGFDGAFKKARYVRQKTYIQELYKKSGKNAYHNDYDDTKWKVTCAGMPDNLKERVTWDNFKVGLKLDGKKIGRQVVGGVVLFDDEFTLKAGE